MTGDIPPIHDRAVEAVAALLERERLMSVATNRPDGWPQVTTVGYIAEGLRLYFVIARKSQKFRNLQADPRMSAAVRAGHGPAGDAVGVSFAGLAEEVVEPAAVERLNQQVIARFPDVHIYCPGDDSVAVMAFSPSIVTAVSVIGGRSHAETFSIGDPPGSTRSPETVLF
ncbi:pyridoxamine 5'-phosphate oxidase family protein [Brevundimonas sp.]|uniref:pyridoxamine 5'-phosphate oxidase family protein n=1 Tax=Brevundimonas sp. TaxID=1871086 RepID=UPI002FC792C6